MDTILSLTLQARQAASLGGIPCTSTSKRSTNLAGDDFQVAGELKELTNDLRIEKKFPLAASVRISLSSVRSDTARRRRAFSCSSSFRRRTRSPFSPPNSRRHLMGWTALPPACRL